MTYHSRSRSINVLRPSASHTDDMIEWIASSTASLSSSSSLTSGPSCIFTRALRTEDRRLLSAEPATETNEASARALNADMGIAVRVGIRMGKTVEART